MSHTEATGETISAARRPDFLASFIDAGGSAEPKRLNAVLRIFVQQLAEDRDGRSAQAMRPGK